MLRRCMVLVTAALVVGGCSDALEQGTTAGQVVAVPDRRTTSVTLISASNLAVLRVVEFPSSPTGRPAGRDNTVLVPSGGEIWVFDLRERADTIARAFPVEPRQGLIGGLAIQDDSIAWATYDVSAATSLPPVYLVARMNYGTGDTASTVLSHYLPDAAATNGRAFVVSVAPDDRSWLTVISGSSRTIVDSVPLTGLGAFAITLGDDGFLYVVSGGPLSVTGEPGRLSVVDPETRTELAVINGLGNPIGRPVFHPSGRLLIPSLDGILEVNTLTRSVTRGPEAAVKPAGHSTTGLALDHGGRVYSLYDDCADPNSTEGFVHILSAPPDYRLLRTITVGPCPNGVAAATIP